MKQKIYSALLFVFLWYLLYFLNVLPAFHVVVITFLMLVVKAEPVLGKTLLQHAASSLLRVLAGAIVAFSLSIPLGILMWFSRIYNLLHPAIEVLRPIPPLAWIPLSYILFASFPNPTVFAQIFIVAVGAFFPSFVTISDYVRGVPQEFIELAKVFGAKSFDLLTKIVLPYSLPGIITGVRVGLGVGWMSIIAAEMIATSGSGLGYFILVMYEVGGRMPEIIAGMAMIGLIGYSMNTLLFKLEERFPWRLKSGT
ncbi:ABC transporter permease [Ferroglobus sp.]|uniref:ABC transporter permease n=1 Tax=Ferroglobus sp. TaxID=2614230 RepID=UPI0025BBDA61|nr:ABC transporter permease [Ferroglobus sp.]